MKSFLISHKTEDRDGTIEAVSSGAMERTEGLMFPMMVHETMPNTGLGINFSVVAKGLKSTTVSSSLLDSSDVV